MPTPPKPRPEKQKENRVEIILNIHSLIEKVAITAPPLDSDRKNADQYFQKTLIDLEATVTKVVLTALQNALTSFEEAQGKNSIEDKEHHK